MIAAWQVDFGPLTGVRNDRVVVRQRPQIPFRGEKVVATDTRGGYGTRVGAIVVGQASQRPALSSTHTGFFTAEAFGNGVTWDECPEGQEISIEVLFVEDCTWDATVFGQARL